MLPVHTISTDHPISFSRKIQKPPSTYRKRFDHHLKQLPMLHKGYEGT
jgi:hypothetical protein